MDLIKMRMLAGIAVTPQHFKEQKELREARDIVKESALSELEARYKKLSDKLDSAKSGSQDERNLKYMMNRLADQISDERKRAKKKDVKEQMGHEMNFNIEPDPSTAERLPPGDPEMQELLAKLKDMSDEEILAYVRDLIAKSHEALGSKPEPDSIAYNGPTDAPVVREDHFKKGQTVKDKKGNNWKVLNSTGGSGKKSDDEVYHLECPKTGKKVDKKASQLHESVIAKSSIEDKNESPDSYANIDQGPHIRDETDEKVTVPPNVKSALKSTITELRQVASRLEKRDPEQAWFDTMAADAMQEILNCLDLGTVTGLKEAQIHTTKLMGPILQRIPSEVFNFIARGDQPRTLKDYFHEVKGFPIEGPRNTLR